MQFFVVISLVICWILCTDTAGQSIVELNELSKPLASVENNRIHFPDEKVNPRMKWVSAIESRSRLNKINSFLQYIQIVNKNEEPWRPLFRAVLNNDLRAIPKMIRSGSDATITVPPLGWTPLHLSSFLGNKWTTNLLMENGADTEIKDNDGMTPLFLAVYKNHDVVVDLLIKKSASVNVKNGIYGGISPLFIAVKNGNTRIINLFIQNRANVNVKDRFGNTPLMVAVTLNNKKIVNLLKRNGARINSTPRNRAAEFVN